jgi:hypothetical protein
LLLCCLSPAAVAGGATGFYGVVLNGMAQPGFVLVVFDDAAQPYMAAKDFKALGFATPVAPVLRDGQALVPLFGQDGMAAQVDASRLTLALDVEPYWYPATRMNLNAPNAAKPLPAPASC